MKTKQSYHYLMLSLLLGFFSLETRAQDAPSPIESPEQALIKLQEEKSVNEKQIRDLKNEQESLISELKRIKLDQKQAKNDLKLLKSKNAVIKGDQKRVKDTRKLLKNKEKSNILNESNEPSLYEQKLSVEQELLKVKEREGQNNELIEKKKSESNILKQKVEVNNHKMQRVNNDIKTAKAKQKELKLKEKQLKAMKSGKS
ncbi:hypothetical protein [Parabacteroides sp. FAFU027]|uniref:hypothetical protein n=1 Tax=Parabacteroides sp. FAFU027 TaxID=2922715 RepID=UPI001FAF9145|nr:hypothetical protein [Parabacteroides sp. FAFU027]